MLWRSAWAETANRYLERGNIDERIDHRSYAARGLGEQPTIHEGVTARALEAKGIISDRCEINRQIKADNTLLRELKAMVNKLMQAVKNTLPAIAEATEQLRSNMMIFKYHLLHIGYGKQSISKSLKMYREDMAKYTTISDNISKKRKERKAALTEKKATPMIQVLKYRNLAKRIAELTEDLEELRSEKAVLFQQMHFPEDATAGSFRREIRTLEDGLEKIEASETKYATELDNALKQYAELQEQAAEFDHVELHEARQAIRPEHEHRATQRVQEAYGDKCDMLRIHDSKRSVSSLLGEDVEERSVREKLRAKQKQKRPRKPKHQEQER